MADQQGKPKGRARGRGRGQSPPPPDSRRPHQPLQQPGMRQQPPLQQQRPQPQPQQQQPAQQSAAPLGALAARPQRQPQPMRIVQPPPPLLQQQQQPPPPQQLSAQPRAQMPRPTMQQVPQPQQGHPRQVKLDQPTQQMRAPGHQYEQSQTVPQYRPTTPHHIQLQKQQQEQPIPLVQTGGGRAYNRGGPERSQQPPPAPQPTDPSAAITAGIARLPYDQPESGNGNGNGNGSNGGATSVGRGTTRGAGRQLEGRLPILRPHQNSKQGTNGTSIKLMVNYFELKKKENWMLYHYSIQYNPEQDDRYQRRELMQPHLKNFGQNYVFDGGSIFTTHRLHEKEVVFTSKTDVVYNLTVTLVRELDPMDTQFLHILNIILRGFQEAIKLKLIGRHYFNPSDAINLDTETKLRVFPGYQTSIRQHESKILLNVDIVHKFQQRTSLLETLSKLRRQDHDNLVGSIVMATYNNLTYRIDAITEDITPLSTFNYRGEQKSYIDYYHEKYGITIKNARQPMIICKPTKRQMRSGIDQIVLVPELMTMTGIPEAMRKNYNQMKMLADYTKMGVDKRVQALLRFNRNLLGNEKVRADMAAWGLELSPQLMTIKGRVLQPEQVYLGDNAVTGHNPDSAEWSTQCRGKKMYTTVHLTNWSVLCHFRFERDISSFISTLQNAARSIGMMINPPEVILVRTWGDVQSEAVRFAGQQIVMVVMDPSLANKYGNLKKDFACNLGVLSQMVLGFNFQKKGIMSIATKIAIQMNAKLGGIPWRIVQPVKGLMVVGYDTYHDSQTRGRSFGAVVSSLNHDCTRFLGQVNAHTSREELSDNFATNIRNAVDRYYHANENTYPKVVFVYRDGVGDGQIEYVKEHEIPAIKTQLKKMSPDVSIALVFIVVCKRINTRMFTEYNGRLSNPNPGTVLDNEITLPERYDFFLVSQKVTQGTVTPTSYNVLEDTFHLKADHMQRITYKFTHLYYNWQGTVRVPAPCLYAHKLAYITGTGTHQLPKFKLLDKLWFI